MNLSENGKSEMMNTSSNLRLKRNLNGFIVKWLDFSLAFVGLIMYLNHHLKELRWVVYLRELLKEDLRAR